MRDFRFRCSSIGKLMTEPKSKAEGPLSVGARTYIRELAAQEIFGVTFEIGSKAIDKGLAVEEQSIAMLNRVRRLSLAKNTERRQNDFITGECDLFDQARKRGHDLKSSWSLQTFPAFAIDGIDKIYEWQMRGYCWLWDADAWEVNYVMVNTPATLLSQFDNIEVHAVSHIPEHMRLTTIVIERDREKEAAIAEKVRHARDYFRTAILEFDAAHRAGDTSSASQASRDQVDTRGSTQLAEIDF